MSYVYDELPPEQRAGLKSHLGACAECGAQVRIWEGVGRDMDRWRLPSYRKTARTGTSVRWAAAAAIVLLATFAGARLVALTNEVKQLRAEVRSSVKNDLNGALGQISEAAARSANAEAQTLVAALAQRLEEQRVADQQATLAALQKLAARHTEDIAVMRKELETVAVFTEAGLQRTQNQLATLAYSPGTFSNNKQD
jgi:hypothetical protein